MKAARSRDREKLLKDFRTDEILRAARRVIGRVGLAAASVEEIANEAGVAKGTLYLYFDGKETLLARCIEDLIAALVAETRESIGESATAADALARIVRVGVSRFLEHRALLVAVRREPSGLDARGYEGVRSAANDYLEVIAGAVERGVASGELRPIEPIWAARVLTELMRTVSIERVPGAASEPSCRAVLDLFLHGISQGDGE